jgi:hypothetical protein
VHTNNLEEKKEEPEQDGIAKNTPTHRIKITTG